MLKKLIVVSIFVLSLNLPAKANFLDPIQLEAVNAVNQYLNNIEHLEGDFLQINPDNSISDGRFYIRRPGRFRFDYTNPESLVVISDGIWLGIIDNELETLHRYPNRSTPYYTIFKKNVNFFLFHSFIQFVFNN